MNVAPAERAGRGGVATALMTRIAQFVFANRLHVIAMGPGIVYFWNQFLGLALSLVVYAVIFGVVWFGYILNIYFDDREDLLNGELSEARHFDYARRAGMMSLVVFLVTVGLAQSIGGGYTALVLLSMVGAGCYSAPFRRAGKRWRVKDQPYLKNLYAAGHWSVILLALAYVAVDAPVTAGTVVVCIVCFLMNFFVELLWDVRDTSGDKLAGVRTIATEKGLNFSRMLLHLTNIATVVVVYVGVWLKLLPISFLLVGAHTFVIAIFVEQFFRLKSKRLASHLYLIYVMLALSAIVIVHSFVG